MPSAKPYRKDQVLAAMSQTLSVMAAARYLGCSYHHIKRYMKLYTDEKTGKSLFEIHKNQYGKGIPKFLTGKNAIKGKEPPISEILNGNLSHTSFTPEKIKYKLVTEGHLKEQCNQCGFNERRVTDYKIPLILHFKDKFKGNYRIENLEFLCYNCYFLYITDVFTERDIRSLEDHKSVTKTTEAIDFELDEYHLKRLKELGLEGNDKENDDPYDLVSYS